MSNDNRFEIIHQDGGILSTNNFCILRDKETGVNYLFVKSGYGAGLTPLLDSRGDVVITMN